MLDIFPDNADLWEWRERESAPVVTPWRPEPLSHLEWPPNYKAVYAWRINTLKQLRADPAALASAKAYYSNRPAEFIMHWFDTYDPRKTSAKWMPFVFFLKQADFIEWLHELRITGESGLCEKSRDLGATWGAVGYSVWSWLFVANDAIGWGSRKQDLVDDIGNPDSIFEKMRLLLRRLPEEFMPVGFNWRKHATFETLINPENGSVISGEAGDNIGRGGRKSIYFKDESAHYERPEKVEAALGDNTRVQIDISSVNGLGNPFHRRRESGVIWERGKKIDPGYVRVFVMDWRDHPEKTQEWYDIRRAKYEREGLLHLFAQEVDRNYAAAQANTIIDYQWIMAAVDAHLKVPYLAKFGPAFGNNWMTGLDVADGGIDRNAFAARQWIICRHVEEWGERDTGTTTRRALDICAERLPRGVRIQYDAVGVGSGVKSEFNRLVQEAIALDSLLDGGTPNFDRLPKLVPWNAGASVLNPWEHIIPDDDESLTNKDFFGNLKAQAWWSLRTRFYKTFQAVTKGVIYPPDELISLDSSMPLLQQLMKELAQPQRASNGALKTIVDKTPDGMKSPNLADGVVMMYFPVPDDYGEVNIGSYGN